MSEEERWNGKRSQRWHREGISGNERVGPVTACCLGHFTRLPFCIDVDFSV